MNKDDAAQYLPLVQALAEGKTIQFLNFPSFNKWEDVTKNGVNFSWPPHRYRIKPEPREIWIITNGRGTLYSPISDRDGALADLDHYKTDGGFPPYTLTKFVAVEETT